MTTPDLVIRSGGASVRLEETADRRPRLIVEADGARVWTADFAARARLTWTGDSEQQLEFAYEPSPDVVIGEHGTLGIRVRVALERGAAGEPVVSLWVDAPADYPLAEEASITVTPERGARDDWRFLVPDGEGLWLRADGTGPGWRPRVMFNNHRITLPMTALVRSTGQALLVSEVDGHDHSVELVPGAGPDELAGLRLVNLASLATWRYERRWTIAALPSGGVPAVAAELTRQLTAGGLELLSQSEKLERRGIPAPLRDSVGGTVLWAHFDLLSERLVRDVRGAGLRSVMFMGRPADEAALAALRETGSASGPYFQTYDIYPTGSVTELGWRNVYPPEGASSGWPEDLIHDLAGWLDPAWPYIPYVAGDTFWQTEPYLSATGDLAHRHRAVHDYTPTMSYRRCPSCHKRVVEMHGIPMLERVGATAVFYDIATAMHGLECFSPRHPVDRRADMAYRREVLDRLSATGRIVHSETGKWWALDSLNAFEGMFSYDADPNISTIQVDDYPYNPERAPHEFDLEHRVPLFGMVARHAVSRTMWWGTGQDRHPETWATKDAITALYGANPIYILDHQHSLVPGTAKWDRFAATTRAFDMLKDVAADARVVSYETDGPTVGRTVFEGGASVEANVGAAAVGDLGPGQFIVRDATGAVVANVIPPAATPPVG